MKRILFVDDEQNVIDGLRRMLRKERKDWDMCFAGGSAEALGLLEQKPFDVIVTDLQMPGMNGAQLLERVVELYPDMVRIVLSGHADEKSTTRAMRVVHQFLSLLEGQCPQVGGQLGVEVAVGDVGSIQLDRAQHG